MTCSLACFSEASRFSSSRAMLDLYSVIAFGDRALAGVWGAGSETRQRGDARVFKV